MNTVQKTFIVSGVLIGIIGIAHLTPVYAQTSTPTPLPSVSPTPVASPLPGELSDYDRDVKTGKDELQKDKADQELRGRVEKIEVFEADEETEPAQKIEEDDRNDNEVEIEDSVDTQKDNSTKGDAGKVDKKETKDNLPTTIDAQNEEGN